MTVTQGQISETVRGLGLSGHPLCVHSSLRSFGWVEGGAEAVIDALLAEGCTLLVPTMSWHLLVGPPPDQRPPRNGIDYEAWDRAHAGQVLPGEAVVYTPASNDIVAGYMGAIPEAVLQRPERQRGNHPGSSFTAIGPLARALIQDQSPTEPYAPFEALSALGGAVVMMGVGLNRLTLLHHAEALAGRNLFMRWANGHDGRPMPIFGGECSSGFINLEPVLAHLGRDAYVGESRWRILPVDETLATAASAIRAQPWITHCADPDCLECHDAILGGPILEDER
jgi:aminoglycoside 3-N-acetyltransferase